MPERLSMSLDRCIPTGHSPGPHPKGFPLFKVSPPEDSSPVRDLLLRAAVGAVVTFAVYRYGGPILLVLLAPLLAAALARPVIEVIGLAMRSIREAAFEGDPGDHHEFRGIPYWVVHDATGRPHVRADDAQRLFESCRESSAQRWRGHIQGLSLQVSEIDGQPTVSAEHLCQMLEHFSEPRAGSLREQLRRDVIVPAERRRGRVDA